MFIYSVKTIEKIIWTIAFGVRRTKERIWAESFKASIPGFVTISL